MSGYVQWLPRPAFSVRAASIENVDVDSPAPGLDMVRLKPGDAVLLRNQRSHAENGVWVFQGLNQPLLRVSNPPAVEVREGARWARTKWLSE